MSDYADFTPNPKRAIWIEGQLNPSLVDRLEHKSLSSLPRAESQLRCS